MIEQVVDHGDLVRDLRATQDDRVGPLRVPQHAREGTLLLIDEESGRVWQPSSQIGYRCLLPVDDPEAITHIRLSPLSPFVGQGGPFLFDLAGLAGVEPHILCHQDLPITEAPHRGGELRARGLADETDRSIENLAQSTSDRAQ